MQDLIILGTGIHAAEMADIVDRINCQSPTWRLLGHVAHPKAQPSGEFFGRPVLGHLDCLDAYPGARVVADNEFPRDIQVDASRWTTLVDPSCFVHTSAQLGPGTVLYPGCFVGARARLGFRFFSLSQSTINHDDVTGDHVVCASGVLLAGVVTVGDYVYLGQGCTVRQFLKLGRNCLIGMGAVVVRDVEPDAVMAGNPARKMKDRVKVP
ncbi:MAG: hypothetical protein A2498_00215 [Lentisphaerae bacterium RIFOXYC12_FULL_60_16]|nr:MAG: hypothetical protein A2498_00215 [Lentisphaerae bacterium RIFOXYC12_FULL_60_16]OGV74508.1 MAG: hypothetical protein A2269_07555 [Lentisphaerae bacterium RIFOXYA12_FULL_60_10]OGV84755.1 MAG: hypothetical protein A2340_04350 [Lentisphaerae bacterium RIFOXYB12_FULL_60_10]